MAEPVLEVEELTVSLESRGQTIHPVDGVSFAVDSAEAFAIVGESGSGKSMTLRAILGLLPSKAHIAAGRIVFNGHELTGLTRKELRRRVAGQMSIVFQEPISALNPVMRVGEQIAEGPKHTLGLLNADAKQRAIELMKRVGIPDPERRAHAYPHELSGGMRQRVMIAIALSCGPRLILCDEPTTALDVTIQDQILKLLAQVCTDTSASLILVTHDLAIVAETAEQLAVMYAGQIVEKGLVEEVFREPRHAYTLQLLRAVPSFEPRAKPVQAIPGTPADFFTLPSGCRFNPRCVFATDECRTGDFPVVPVTDKRSTACIHHEECAASVHADPVISSERVEKEVEP